MQSITVKQLSKENFEKYGVYTDLMDPMHPFYKRGQPQFYSDLLKVDLGKHTGASISVGIEKKRSKNTIEFAEFHRYTGEGMMALNDDVIIYLAPATGKKVPPFSYFEAFYIPKGVFVSIKAGIWHGCQLPVKQETVYNMIVLPELTYANDMYCYFFKEEEKISIRL